MATVESILISQGIDPRTTGPYVTEWKDAVQKMLDDGMEYMSGGTWGDDAPHDSEERARVMLAFMWAADKSCKVECFDVFPINKRYDVKKDKWFYEFRPDKILPYIRDTYRRVASKVLLKLAGPNPYV